MNNASGESGKTTLAVAIGRRVMLLIEESKTDSEMGFEYTHIKVCSALSYFILKKYFEK